MDRRVYSWYRAGDALTSSSRRVKIETLKARLLGGPRRTVAIHLSTEGDSAAIARFLAVPGPLEQVADRASGLR